MLSEQAAHERAPPKSALQLLKDKNVRWQLVSMSVIICCNGLSGVSAVMMTARFQTLLSSLQSLICGLPARFQITIFSYDIFLKSGIPSDKIRYVTLGQGLCEIFTSIFCVSDTVQPYSMLITLCDVRN